MKKSVGGQITHGAMRFLNTGILPKGKKHIARLIDGVINDMVLDLGGENEISASQKIIISAIRQNLIFLMLINEWIAAQPSLIDNGQVLAPLNGFYLACQNSVTRNCRELGLKRVSPVESLAGYLEAKAKEAHGERANATLSKGAAQENIIESGASCERNNHENN